MSRDIDMGLRLQRYGSLLARLCNGVDRCSYEEKSGRFYVLCNQLAGMFALQRGVLLPGANERTDAIAFIMQIAALLCADRDDDDDDDDDSKGKQEISHLEDGRCDEMEIDTAHGDPCFLLKGATKNDTHEMRECRSIVCRFLRDQCVVSSDRVLAQDILERFKQWLLDNHVQVKISTTMFGKLIKDNNKEKGKTGMRVYIGIKLK